MGQCDSRGQGHPGRQLICRFLHSRRSSGSDPEGAQDSALQRAEASSVTFSSGLPGPSGSYRTTALISHASKVMLNILQARLQQYMNHEVPDVQAGFRKGRGTRDQTANICWIMEKAREFQKNIYFCTGSCGEVGGASSIPFYQSVGQIQPGGTCVQDP